MHTSIQTKVFFSVGAIIVLVLGTSTLLHVRDIGQEYLQALTWRAEGMAQALLLPIGEWLKITPGNIQDLLGTLSSRCQQVYERNRDDDVLYVAVINAAGVFAAHSDHQQVNTPIASPAILAVLQAGVQPDVALDDSIYHVLIPIRDPVHGAIGAVAVGMPRALVRDKTNAVFKTGAALLLGFILIASTAMFLVVRQMITQPIRRLVRISQQIAQGNWRT
jgi:sensor histidine kinase regulating citrate/malate metabolism